MNSSAELLPQFPQNRDELVPAGHEPAFLGCRFDEALACWSGCSSFIPVTVACTRSVATVTSRCAMPAGLSVPSWQAVNINAALPASWQMLHTLYRA
jgi:hypothetical protein